MIVAGEASGDLHAAKLVTAMRELFSPRELHFFGCAGAKMRDAGVEPVVRADSLAIVGLPEIARALPLFISAFRLLKAAAIEQEPDVAILVDFPDFNLKLAKSLKRAGFKVVYYISPQLWAWRKYRLRSVRKYVDLMLTILPFEADWYLERGVSHIEYVGSPLAMEVSPQLTKAAFCSRYGIDPERPIVALLPGSREKEISRILPVMLDAASRLVQERSDIQFVAAAASIASRTAIAELLRLQLITETASAPKVTVVENETYDVLNSSDAAAVTSGTATLETGIIGTPMAIVYKTSPINYKLLHPLISVEHFGLINLIANERIAAELIQDEFTANSLADELKRLLEPATNAAVREKLRVATDRLGSGGASKRAALAIKRIIERPVNGP